MQQPRGVGTTGCSKLSTLQHQKCIGPQVLEPNSTFQIARKWRGFSYGDTTASAAAAATDVK